jgi:hypothetical protein
MAKKQKRNFTLEQRQAAGDRLRKMHEDRKAKKLISDLNAHDTERSTAFLDSPMETDEQFQARRLRERQDRLASYDLKPEDQERMVHAQAIQAQVLEKAAIAVPALSGSTRIGSREVSLIVKTDGTMASLYGPCICGKPKREWHPLCLRGNSNAA